jgi:hypothetical protein
VPATNPHQQHRAERQQETPGAAEARELVRNLVAERTLFFELFFSILGNRVLLGDAFSDFSIELGEFAVVLLEQFLGVAHAVAREFAQAHHRVGRQRGKVPPDEVRKRRPKRVQPDQVTLAIALAADRRGDALGRRLGDGFGRNRPGLDRLSGIDHRHGRIDQCFFAVR